MNTKQELVIAILDYLNELEVRATYGAVAEVLGVLPRSVGQQFLGESDHTLLGSFVKTLVYLQTTWKSYYILKYFPRKVL